jgi:hypothetical protein
MASLVGEIVLMFQCYFKTNRATLTSSRLTHLGTASDSSAMVASLWNAPRELGRDAGDVRPVKHATGATK